jgi:signal transduction histidine kinase
MKERLEEVGGELQLESQPDSGFTIKAFIPLTGEFV